MTLSRRKFLTTSAAGAAATTIGAPAIAKGITEWRMVTSWPKNSPGPGMTAQRLADRITAMSDGRLKVTLYAAGELVPALEVFDAVSAGNAEMAHTAALFWQGKMKASFFYTSVPFGLTAEEHCAWIYHGGGQALWDELYAPFGIKPFMAGNTGMQMGGWFSREITALDDLKGIKQRVVGVGGEIMRRMGVSPVVLAPGEIYGALQSGLVDAAEFLGPWTDTAFGFYKVAPYYYWPGFNKPNGTGEALVNKAALDRLPPDLKAVVENAVQAENSFALAESDWENARALQRLSQDYGVKLRQFPEDVLAEARRLAPQALDDRMEGDELGQRILASYREAIDLCRDWGRVGRQAFLRVQ